MKKITGSYIKSNSEVPFTADVPSEWQELDKNQFARIIEILNYTKADKYTVSVSLLALLFNSENWHILHNLPDEMLFDLVPLTNFLFEEKPPIKNFFPILNINKKTCLAPADDLSNLSFGEWCFVHQFYIYYSITRDQIWLDKLITCIYRPKDLNQVPDDVNFNGDEREKFNENLLEKRSLSVAHIERHIKLAILAWFTVAMNGVTETRPHVFPPPPPIDLGNPQPEPEPEQAQNSQTWMTIFRDLLGPKFGTTETLKHTNAMFVLDELEEKHIAYEEAKKSN